MVKMVEWEQGGRSTTLPWHRGRQAWRSGYEERIWDACRGDLKERWDECRILLGACLWWVQRTESTEANNCITLWQWKTVQSTQAMFLGFLVNSLYFGSVESHKQTVKVYQSQKRMLYETDMKENSLQNVQQAYTARHLYDIVLGGGVLSAAITSK